MANSSIWIGGIECAILEESFSFEINGLGSVEAAVAYTTEDTISVAATGELKNLINLTRLAGNGDTYDCAVMVGGVTVAGRATVTGADYRRRDDIDAVDFLVKIGNGSWIDKLADIRVCDHLGTPPTSNWLTQGEEWAFPTVPTDDPYSERVFVCVPGSTKGKTALDLEQLSPIVRVSDVLVSAFDSIGYQLNGGQQYLPELINKLVLPTGWGVRDDYELPPNDTFFLSATIDAVPSQTIWYPSDVLMSWRANPLNVPNPNYYFRAPFTGVISFTVLVNGAEYYGNSLLMSKADNRTLPPTTGGVPLVCFHQQTVRAGEGFRIYDGGLNAGDNVDVTFAYFANSPKRTIEWRYNAWAPRDAFVPKTWNARYLFAGVVKLLDLRVITNADQITILPSAPITAPVRDFAGAVTTVPTVAPPFFSSRGNYEVTSGATSYTVGEEKKFITIKYAGNGIELSEALETANKIGTWALAYPDKNESDAIEISEFASAPNSIIPHVTAPGSQNTVQLPTVGIDESGAIPRMVPLVYVGFDQSFNHPLAVVDDPVGGTTSIVRPLMAYQFDPFTAAIDDQLVFGKYYLIDKVTPAKGLYIDYHKQRVLSELNSGFFECDVVGVNRLGHSGNTGSEQTQIERNVFGVGASDFVLESAVIEDGARWTVYVAKLVRLWVDAEDYAAELATQPRLNLIESATDGDGEQGEQGEPGLPGANGSNGTNGQDGQDGADGSDGADGLSAYQIALQNGFVGSESEWLASLVGANGTNGTNGQGVPTGGTAGQILQKVNGTDFNTVWTNPQTFKAELLTDFLTNTANTWTTITGFTFTPEVNSLYRVEVYGARTITSAVAASQGLRLFMSGASQFIQHEFEAIVPSSGSAGTFMYSVNINSAATQSVASASTAANVTLRPLVASGHFKTGATVGAVSVQVNAVTVASIMTVHAGAVFIVTKIV